MMVIGLCLRPWVMKMRSMDVQPKVLADALIVTAAGLCHAVKAEAAIDTTHRMMHDTGSKVSPHKA